MHEKHNDATYARAENAYRVAGPYPENSFGVVEIDWDAHPAPTITQSIVNLQGPNVIKHRIGLNASKHPVAE